MENIIIGLIAVLLVVIAACGMMWVEISGLTDVLAQTRRQLRDHLWESRYPNYFGRQPRSPIEDDVEAELPWEKQGGAR